MVFDGVLLLLLLCVSFLSSMGINSRKCHKQNNKTSNHIEYEYEYDSQYGDLVLAHN